MQWPEAVDQGVSLKAAASKHPVPAGIVPSDTCRSDCIGTRPTDVGITERWCRPELLHRRALVYLPVADHGGGPLLDAQQPRRLDLPMQRLAEPESSARRTVADSAGL